VEKLIYLVWDRPSRGGADVRAQLIDDVAPRLLALGPHGLQIDVDDDEADFSSMVPVPDDELPVRAGVSIWVDAHDYREPYETILSEVGIRRAGYLVTESVPQRCTDRDWPDGKRSPGVTHFTWFPKPARLSDEEFFRAWHEVHTPFSFELHPLRWEYVRNAVARPLTPVPSPAVVCSRTSAVSPCPASTHHRAMGGSPAGTNRPIT